MKLSRSVEVIDALVDAVDSVDEQLPTPEDIFDLSAMEEQMAFRPDLMEPDSRFLPEDIVLAGSPVLDEIEQRIV